ncbi:MAG: hypothetical protein JAY74_15430 [Candidatus Thiodiazotropha taylori]|nr:hypothetical protein [Candidatus Thiodiazotropha taylori]
MQLRNRVRGFALEYCVKFPNGFQHLRKQVPVALKDAENELTMVARACLKQLLDQLILLDEVIKETTETLVIQAKQIMPVSDLKRFPVSDGSWQVCCMPVWVMAMHSGADAMSVPA